jgi:hypothetical protein
MLVSEVYSKVKIDDDDLRQFAEKALEVISKTEYGRKYKPGIAAIALCQGGANHYVVVNGYARHYYDPQRAGLKDIDIWFFFNKQGFHPQWKLVDDFGPSKFGQNPEEPKYVGRRMDFFGRSISFQPRDTIKSAVERWVKSGVQGSSAWHLSNKAIVAIYPENIVGNILWINPNLV